MPTRSYFFPPDFSHLEEILRAEPGGFPDELQNYFRSKSIPPIPSESALPRFLGISPKTIYSIRRNKEKHYRVFSIPKRDGTRREVQTPRTYLKVIQWWILDNILDSATVAENVFGFVAGRSAIKNALYHRGSNHLLNVDIQQFFPSITQDQVVSVFEAVGYNNDVSRYLAELCCFRERVPQGAPTSPAIANLVLATLDKELTILAGNANCRYSRYADDLSFSSTEIIDIRILDEITKAVAQAGFTLKKSKTRFAGKGERMEVTGVVINEVIQPTVDWRKKVRARIHKLSTSPRLVRADINFLYGVRGMAAQYPESAQMIALASKAEELCKSRAHTVIGFGSNPILPNGLTLRQAEVLASLLPRRTNSEIALQLGSSEAAIKKRLQEAFRKIGSADRTHAEKWAREYL
jgi:RNA-directed DNA polymerase